MPSGPTEILTVREVADYLKVRPGTVYRMAVPGRCLASRSTDRGAFDEGKSTSGPTLIARRRETPVHRYRTALVDGDRCNERTRGREGIDAPTLRLVRTCCFAFLLACAGAGAHEHSVSTHVSPDGRVTAVVTAPARSGAYLSEEPARVAMAVKGKPTAAYELFKGFPDTVLVLNDGRLVTLGRGCCPKDRVNRLIAVFDSDGEIAFEANLHELVRLASSSVKLSQAGHYIGPRWFREARLADDGSVAVVLADYNELRLSLADIELVYVKVPDEDLGELDLLRERGIAWLEGGREDEGLAMLEDLSHQVPMDRQAASRLARYHVWRDDHHAAIAVLTRLIEEHPLVADDRTFRCNSPSSPFGMRCDLIRAYLGAGRADEAMGLIDTIRPYANPDADLDLLAIDALLTLGRPDEADSLALAVIARERDGSGAQWRVRSIQKLYLRHGLGRQVGEVVARAGVAEDDPEVLEERARGLIRAKDAAAAVPVLHALRAAGRRAVAATLLGDVHAFGRDGVPLDLEAARRWYETAVHAPDAESRDARSDLRRAQWRLCQLSLVGRAQSRLADAARLCGLVAAEESSDFRGDGIFWSAIVHLDSAFDGADAERGLSLLESVHCPPLGWSTRNLYFRDKYAKDLYTWASRTLERYVDRDRVQIELCLGRLYGRAEDAASPPFRPDRARDLLTAAAAHGSTDALLELAHLVKRHFCCDGCTKEVRAIYRRAAEMSEAWGHYYLAELIVEDDADAALPEALYHLKAFSTMRAKASRDYYCRQDRRDTSRHAAESLYEALETRPGHPVERTPDRGC